MDAGLTGTQAGDAAGAAPVGPRYAVVSSNWSSTAISLLDAEGELVADDYLSSGSTASGLVTTLSGDVVLPKASGEPSVLVILDRFRTDVVTRIRLADAVVLGQVKTNTPPGQDTRSSYSSNPQDYIYLDADTAWVTRSEPNLDSHALAIDLGNDLFRLDPTTMQRAGERIDLGALDQQVASAGGTVTVYARPSRMVRLGHTLVIGIGRSSFDFRVLGDGAVALVDLDDRSVSAFALPGLKNCTEVDAVPGDADTVLVSCGGDWNGDRRASAGLALVGVHAGSAQLQQLWRASDDAATVPLISSTVALGGTLVGAASNDYSGSGPDVYAVLDLASGQQTVITSIAAGSGAFGTPAYDAERGLLLLPDASVDKDRRPTAGLRRFQRHADGSFTELSLVRVATRTDMPVRHVFPL